MLPSVAMMDHRGRVKGEKKVFQGVEVNDSRVVSKYRIKIIRYSTQTSYVVNSSDPVMLIFAWLLV
jgi:hypothetical protein